MGKLHWGIVDKDNSYGSRDVGDLIYVKSLKEACKRIKKLKIFYEKRGYKIWFANYKDSPESKFINIKRKECL
jgi:hypothetical protein